jgi:hypothetical protein
MRPEKGGSRFKLCLPTARDVDARAFLHENLAVARPIPEFPPVMTAIFPSSFGIFFLRYVGLHEYRSTS